jgi:hypothetical protein
LVLYAQDDDVLAAALAHALAHLLFDDGAVDDLAAEQRADQMGILLAGAAGYDVDATVGYWEEMARAYPWIVAPRRSRGFGRDSFRSFGARVLYDHHDLARRMPGIRARVAEVKERIARATADAGGAAP